MNKTLLKNYDDFQNLIDENTGILGWYGMTITMLDSYDDTRPEKYPCVAVWEIVDNDDGPCHLESEFVYLDDFVDLADFVNLDNFDEEDKQEEEEVR